MLRTVSLSWIAKNNIKNPYVRITGFTKKPLPIQWLGINDCEILFLDNPHNIIGNASRFFFPKLCSIYVPSRLLKDNVQFYHENINIVPGYEYVDQFESFKKVIF